MPAPDTNQTDMNKTKLLISKPLSPYITVMRKDPIYLDYNASAPPREQAIETATNMMSAAHNASSVHALGRHARASVEKAREQIANLVNIPSGQIVFNSGATEGNNTVLRHMRETYPDERIIVSAIEHPCVLEAIQNAMHIPVTTDGVIDLEALESILSDGTRTCLVSVMMVNNETGIIQPIKDIIKIARKYGAMIHTDAVQAAGRIEIDMTKLGVDFLTLSSHKIGGPQGVGALALGSCGITPTLLHGGGQEKKARAGTENVAGIAGFGIAAELATKELSDYQSRIGALQKTLETRLKNLSDDIIIYGENTPRVCNTTLLSIAGQTSESLLMAFDLAGLCVSNGSACSSGSVQASHVLKAMGASNLESRGALRISTGWNTKASDIDAFVAEFEKIITRINAKKSA